MGVCLGVGWWLGGACCFAWLDSVLRYYTGGLINIYNMIVIYCTNNDKYDKIKSKLDIYIYCIILRSYTCCFLFAYLLLNVWVGTGVLCGSCCLCCCCIHVLWL